MRMSESNKKTGGSCCAVATCKNYARITKRDGNTSISYHRFPKDLERQKLWALKCRRGDKWNPSLAYICSEHFSKDHYVRDLKSELLGYTPKVRLLKPDAIPTINLPADLNQIKEVSQSTLHRRQKMESRAKKQDHDNLITTILNSSASSTISNEETTLHINTHTSCLPDYEQLYNKLLNEHTELQNKYSLQNEELLYFKQSDIKLKQINESLRSGLKVLEKQLRITNLLIKQSQKKTTKQIKLLL